MKYSIILFLVASVAKAEFRDEGVWERFPVRPPVTKVKHQSEEITTPEAKATAIATCKKELEQESSSYKQECETVYGALASRGAVVNLLTETTISCQFSCVARPVEINGCEIRKYLMVSSSKQFFLVEQKNGDGVFNQPLYLEKDASEIGAVAELIEMVKTRPEGLAKCPAR